MPIVECRGVSVSFGAVAALRSVDLSIDRGESVALLGPSGSGKSTLLHALAGFIDIDTGQIELDGMLMSTPAKTAAPEVRQIGFVFQNYALWPHLTALATVAYPMRREGMAASDADAAAQRLLDVVGVGDLAHRLPEEMSGGQQQRIGLARALARSASLYLLDEPTAHLDAALRSSVHEEIVRRRRKTGSAAVYATHDAAEALAVADRVVVLRTGRIVQAGTPTEIYEQPVDVWVAELTGPVSVLSAKVGNPPANGAHVSVGGRRIPADGELDPMAPSVSVLIRPEWVSLTPRRSSSDDVPATVQQRWFRGPHTDYRLLTPVGVLECRVTGPPQLATGAEVACVIHRSWIPPSR